MDAALASIPTHDAHALLASASTLTLDHRNTQLPLDCVGYVLKGHLAAYPLIDINNNNNSSNELLFTVNPGDPFNMETHLLASPPFYSLHTATETTSTTKNASTTKTTSTTKNEITVTTSEDNKVVVRVLNLNAWTACLSKYPTWKSSLLDIGRKRYAAYTRFVFSSLPVEEQHAIDTKRKERFLKRVPLFTSLSDALIRSLAQSVSLIHIPASSTIHFDCGSIYILIRGSMGVYVGSDALDVLKRGDLVRKPLPDQTSNDGSSVSASSSFQSSLGDEDVIETGRKNGEKGNGKDPFQFVSYGCWMYVIPERDSKEVTQEVSDLDMRLDMRWWKFTASVSKAPPLSQKNLGNMKREQERERKRMFGGKIVMGVPGSVWYTILYKYSSLIDRLKWRLVSKAFKALVDLDLGMEEVTCRHPRRGFDKDRVVFLIQHNPISLTSVDFSDPWTTPSTVSTSCLVSSALSESTATPLTATTAPTPMFFQRRQQTKPPHHADVSYCLSMLISTCRFITSLNLSSPTFPSLPSLASLTYLSSLTLPRKHASLPSLPTSLTNLTLSDLSHSLSSSSYFLRSLRICTPSKPPSTLSSFISSLPPFLTSLDFSNYILLRDTDILYLSSLLSSSLLNIRTLNFSNCTNLTIQSILLLSQSSHRLNVVTVSGCHRITSSNLSRFLLTSDVELIMSPISRPQVHHQQQQQARYVFPYERYTNRFLRASPMHAVRPTSASSSSLNTTGSGGQKKEMSERGKWLMRVIERKR